MFLPEVGPDHVWVVLAPRAGVPVAIGLPKSSTITRSARSITRPMSCSTRMIGMPQLVADVEDEAGHVLGLLEVHAGDRLVEQQQLGLHGQRPAELDPLLHAVGQQADREPAPLLELEEVDDVLDRGAVGELLAPGPAEPERRRTARRTCMWWWRPSIRLSITVRLANSSMFWNVRAMPSCGDLVRARGRSGRLAVEA